VTDDLAPPPAAPAPRASAASILSRGFRLCLDNWRLLLPFVVVTMFGQIAQQLLSPTEERFANVAITDTPDEYLVAILGRLALFFAVSAALWLLVLVPASLGLTTGLGYRALAQPIAVGGALRAGLRRYPHFLLTAILQNLIVLGSLLPLVVLLFAVGWLSGSGAQMDPEARLLFGAAGWVLGCGLAVVLLVALVYLGTRLGFATTAALLGSRNPIEALQHSWELTRGNVLRVFGIEVLVTLPLFALLLCIIPMSFAASMISLSGGGPVASVLGGANSLLLAGVGSLYTPVLVAVSTVLWYQLRREQAPVDEAALASELPEAA